MSVETAGGFKWTTVHTPIIFLSLRIWTAYSFWVIGGNSTSNHPGPDTLMSRILLTFGPLTNTIETKRSWKFLLKIQSGCHFRALLIFTKICPKMHPRHFENYNFTHISSFKHTLALKIGTDKVFDATNPKMKSYFQKNKDLK